MNKKGYLKTLEAIIAIILLLVVVYTVIPKYIEPRPEPPIAVQDAQRFIVNDISSDDELRATILTSTDDALISSGVEKVVREHMLPNYDFVCAICPQTSACVMPSPLDKSVYMSDVFVASSMGFSLGEQRPKIVRFWMWQKPTNELAFYNACRVVRV
ncbi:MAG: hypothetical protein ABIH63_03795 [archaeon]